MKLSTFSKSKHLPSKEEKGKEARFTSKPYKPEIVEVTTKDDLIEVLTSKCWSPFIFTEFRREDNFISTDFLVYDIDEGQRIEDVEKIVQDLNLICLVLPTTSHTPENHRFRVVLPLSKTITKADSYKATYAKMAEYFSIDPACSDLARFYFGSTMDDGFWYSHGKLLDPVVPERAKKAEIKRYDSREPVVVGDSIEELVVALYGEPRAKIPDNIAYWLEEAPNGLSGEWHNTCNSAIFTLGLQNVDQEVVEEVFRTIAPNDLDQHDEYLLDRAWQDGYNARGEEL
jgi:hypothetical protein